MIAAKENIVGIVETKRGNKFNRTESWEERHDYVFNGQYMGNCNTLVFHDHGCSDILEMNDEHKVPTNNEQGIYRPCGHCKPGFGRFATLYNFGNVKDEPEDIEYCYDSKIEKIFQGVKCDCGSFHGVLKMRPHDGGVRLLGRREKMWIWRECFDCGHQMSLEKAKNKRKSMNAYGEI